MTTKQNEKQHGQSKPTYVTQRLAYVVISLTVYKRIQRGQCTYNVTLKRFRATIFAVEKQLVLNILECVFLAFGIQALLMSHTVICGLPGFTVKVK
jgi:hypothetical protein